MINKDELLFVVDEDNNPIEPRPRSEVHRKGYWHRTSHIWVINDKKEILCHKRSLLKDVSPGNWDPYFGGHFGPKSSYLEGAITELQEEIGLKVKPEELALYKIYKNKTNIEFQGIYVYSWNGDSKQLTFEKEEIDEVAWYTIAEIQKETSSVENKKWSKIEYLQDMLSWLNKR